MARHRQAIGPLFDDQALQEMIRATLLERPKNISELMALLHLTRRQLLRHLHALRAAGEISHPVETGRGPRWVLRKVPTKRHQPHIGDPQPKAPPPRQSWWLSHATTEAPRSGFYAALRIRDEGAEWQAGRARRSQGRRSADPAIPEQEDIIKPLDGEGATA